MSIRAIALILTIFSLWGCAVTTERELLVLPACPPSPVYPKISDKELEALTNKTYVKLVDLISLRDEYINELKAYCDDTN